MGRLSDFFNKIFRRQKALPEAEIEENVEENVNTVNVVEEKEENNMNEHEKWIEDFLNDSNANDQVFKTNYKYVKISWCR